MVVIDTNTENPFLTDLEALTFNKLELRIERFNFTNEHPFRLATKHRASMLKRIDKFDWFMYTEDDTMIPPDTMAVMVADAANEWAERRRVFAMTRVVSTGPVAPTGRSDGKEYFSDLLKPLPKAESNGLEVQTGAGVCVGGKEG